MKNFHIGIFLSSKKIFFSDSYHSAKVFAHIADMCRLIQYITMKTADAAA